MSRQPRPCAHCGEPIQPKGNGRPPKVHAECRAAYKAERERQRRREIDPEVGSEARRISKLHAYDALRVRNLFAPKDARGHEIQGKVFDPKSKTWVKVDFGPDKVRKQLLHKAGPGGMAWGDDGKPVGIHFDPLPDDTLAEKFWVGLAHKVAFAVSSSTAHAYDSIKLVLQGHGQRTALRHADEMIAEPVLYSQEMRLKGFERRYEDVLVGIGKAGIQAFDRTHDPRILAALADVPRLKGLGALVHS